MVESPTDLQKAQMVYADLINFISAYSILKPGVNTVKILETEYIDKGTAGLKFLLKSMLGCKKLAKAIQKYPEDYR